MSRSSCTPLPSSVKSRTPSAAISAIGASRSPARPTVMAPPRCDVAQRRAAEVEHLADHAGASRWPARCWAWPRTRGVAAERRGPGPGLDRLGLLPAGLAQVGVEVDQAGGDDAAAGVEVAVGPQVGGLGLGPTAAMRPSVHEHVGPALAGGVDHRAAPDDAGDSSSVLRLGGSRAGAEQPEQHRHAHGDAVAHLVDDRPSGAGRRPRRRSRRPGSSGRGASRAPARRSRSTRRRVSPKRGGVLPQRRDQRLGHALLLHPQQVDRRRPWAAPRRGRGSPRPASPRGVGGSSVGGRHQRDLGAERGEGARRRSGRPGCA